MKTRRWTPLFVCLSLSGCAAQTQSSQPNQTQPAGELTAQQANAALHRTINFGDMLEAKTEGANGLRVEEKYFDLAKQAGFTAVRLPIRWNAHAQMQAPYTIDPAFFDHIDQIAGWSQQRHLTLILDFHHYLELMDDPAAHRERYLALWRQIAEHYRQQPAQVYFELLNEPHGKLGDVWDDYQNAALKVVRASNPARTVLVTGAQGEVGEQLGKLHLPADPHLIATFHTYTPMVFTHQGTDFTGSKYPAGMVWPATGLRPVNLWREGSWYIQTKGVKGGLEIQQTQRYGAYRLHREQPVNGVQAVNFVVSRDLELDVSCPPRHNPAVTKSVRVKARANEVTRVPAAQCGSDAAGTVGDVYLSPVGQQPQPAFVLSRWDLQTSAGTHTLLGTPEQEALEPLRTASEWATAQQRPLFMGEFGVYKAANNASRVRWAAALRGEAERLNISWGWWELASGFGVYDPKTGQWNKELLKALIP